ncbi:MAG: phosphoglycerate kinase [Chloroflexi bacterium]|nr:MAG: phosphoglycerate kinase [Chloroflexota bacterium]TMF17798.1 MAG: phosphoglycerate kinase [Chloroflexota bacterium]TMF33027.1 MAG: phosphoglycerate kinase [Chloroflexota bacterium]TMG29795.1 MAG: phosphoglycerate kinase [Chloroflexota bacterium]
MKASITSVDVAGKRVLVREDLNVPMAGGTIADDSRVRAAAPTLAHLARRGARVIVMSHLGRPKDREPELSLKPIVPDLARRVGRDVRFAEDCVGEPATSAVDTLQSGQLLLLENVRYHKEDEANDAGFARRLAALGDLFVNDAFAASHRAHASVVGVAAYLPAFAGELMEAELRALRQALDNPRRPMVALVGGAKVSTKVGVLRNLLQKVDSLLIGGAMANTFFKARGWPTGSGLVEDTALKEAKEVAAEAGDKLVLPVDVVCARKMEAGEALRIMEADKVEPGWMALDIGPRSISLFNQRVRGAGTVIWNGPVGVAEIKDFGDGTKAVGEAIAASGAYTLVGGGDTVAAIESLGLAGRFSHVSTGGGATLEYLEGKELPGIAILKEA